MVVSMGCFSGCCGVVLADYLRGGSSRSIPLADIKADGEMSALGVAALESRDFSPSFPSSSTHTGFVEWDVYGMSASRGRAAASEG
jgi:hypothetical protein